MFNKRLWKFEVTLSDGQTLYVGKDGSIDSESMFTGDEMDARNEAQRRVLVFELVTGITPESVRYESHGKVVSGHCPFCGFDTERLHGKD